MWLCSRTETHTCSLPFYTDPTKCETPSALSDAVSGECVLSLVLHVVISVSELTHSSQCWCEWCGGGWGFEH